MTYFHQFVTALVKLETEKNVIYVPHLGGHAHNLIAPPTSVFVVRNSSHLNCVKQKGIIPLYTNTESHVIIRARF